LTKVLAVIFPNFVANIWYYSAMTNKKGEN